MKILIPAILLAATATQLHARGGGGGGGEGGGFGGGGFREGGFGGGEGFREEAPRFDDSNRQDVNIQREGNNDFRVEDNNGSANVRVRPDGDDEANVNVRTSSGKDYDTNVVGPDGYRGGYIWQNGGYVAVNCDPFVPYFAPFGPWAGWSVVTQPVYLNYPVYTTYPVETAVQVALQQIGLYNGPIDGQISSCRGAIENYQQQNGLTVTGTINPELLKALGIQASSQG
jgi:hypothetical protein